MDATVSIHLASLDSPACWSTAPHLAVSPGTWFHGVAAEGVEGVVDHHGPRLPPRHRHVGKLPPGAPFGRFFLALRHGLLASDDGVAPDQSAANVVRTNPTSQPHRVNQRCLGVVCAFTIPLPTVEVMRDAQPGNQVTNF